MELTSGNDSGFTYERYKQNRAGFVVSYLYPNLSFIPAIIFSISAIPVDNPTHYDFKNAIILMSGLTLIHLFVILRDFFKRNEDVKIDLHDVLSDSDLDYMANKNDTLETKLFLHKLSKNRNERSLLLIQNKEYLKELVMISPIIRELRKIEEALTFLKKIKEMLSESEYESKKEKLTTHLKDYREMLQTGIHSTLVAIGKEKTVEQEKQEELYLKKNMNQLLNEDAIETVALPVPILELQELVKTSVDEDMKKEAQEALDLANQLFEDSKRRNEDSAKEFVRMKQQAVIDTALQEMRKL